MKEQYLQELEARLSNRVPPQELVNIMRYYQEYFDEAGLDRVANVIGELGSPAELTRRIMGEPSIDEQAKDEWEQEPTVQQHYVEYRAYRRPMPVLVALFLMVFFVIPIAFGLGMALLGLGVAGVACVAVSVVNVVTGFMLLLSVGLATTMYFVGGGMLAGGLGLLLLGGTVSLTGLFFRGLGKLTGAMFGRRGVAA